MLTVNKSVQDNNSNRGTMYLEVQIGESFLFMFPCYISGEELETHLDVCKPRGGISRDHASCVGYSREVVTLSKAACAFGKDAGMLIIARQMYAAEP
jgi:hypothetical protein